MSKASTKVLVLEAKSKISRARRRRRLEGLNMKATQGLENKF